MKIVEQKRKLKVAPIHFGKKKREGRWQARVSLSASLYPAHYLALLLSTASRRSELARLIKQASDEGDDDKVQGVWGQAQHWNVAGEVPLTYRSSLS